MVLVMAGPMVHVGHGRRFGRRARNDRDPVLRGHPAGRHPDSQGEREGDQEYRQRAHITGHCKAAPRREWRPVPPQIRASRPGCGYVGPMKHSITIGLAAALLPAAALAASYRVELAPPRAGKLLIGHAGVQAADDRTATALVRLVAPGNEVRQRGTVRVLVMNLGDQPFEFGPEQMTLKLADGTELKPTPFQLFEKGANLIDREMHRGGAVDIQNRNNLSGLAQQSSGGPTAQNSAPMQLPSSAGGSPTLGQDRQTDEMLTPGAKTMDALYQVLQPLTVEPQKAWGGYYVFDVPKAVFARKVDQPMTILVRTGAEEHRFEATLRWR